MRLKLTFEDGSSGYLKHYGVLGMKWGVRNAETLARYNRKGIRGAGANVNFSGGGGAIQDETDPENLAEIEKHPEMWKRIEGENTPESAQAAVNPYYTGGKIEREIYRMFDQNDKVKDGQLYGSIVNCATCSMIYDLRRRGYDVDASMTQNASYIFSTNNVSDYYENASTKHHKFSEDAFKELNSYPNGSRGVLTGLNHSLVSGHAVAWERENGKTVFRDCQTNKVYDESTLQNIYVYNTKTTKNPTEQYSLSVTRLDDKKPKLSAFYNDGLVSEGGTKGQKDRRDDAVRQAKAQADVAERTYERIYGKKIQDESFYDDFRKAADDYLEKARNQK